MTVAMALLVFLLAGYVGGRLHAVEIARRGCAALTPEARAALAEYATILREVAAADGRSSPELEAAIGRMLEAPAAAPGRRSRLSGDEAWEVFWADFAPERDHAAALDLLSRWAGRVRWDAERRALAVGKFKDKEEARRVVDRAWLGGAT